jgi:hypothetical protein
MTDVELMELKQLFDSCTMMEGKVFEDRTKQEWSLRGRMKSNKSFIFEDHAVVQDYLLEVERSYQKFLRSKLQ